MEIGDLDVLIDREQKKYMDRFRINFFIDMGGEVVEESFTFRYAIYKVKIEEKILEFSIWKDGTGFICKVDNEEVSRKYDDPMFWDILKNGKDKYRIKKDVPEGFTLKIDEHPYYFKYYLETEYYSEELKYPISNEEIEEKADIIRKKTKHPKLNNKYLLETFPEAKCYRGSHFQFWVELQKIFNGIKYEVVFQKQFNEKPYISEDLWYKMELLASKKTEGEEIDDLISHVQKNLKKLE